MALCSPCMRIELEDGACLRDQTGLTGNGVVVADKPTSHAQAGARRSSNPMQWTWALCSVVFEVAVNLIFSPSWTTMSKATSLPGPDLLHTGRLPCLSAAGGCQAFLKTSSFTSSSNEFHCPDLNHCMHLTQLHLRIPPLPPTSELFLIRRSDTRYRKSGQSQLPNLKYHLSQGLPPTSHSTARICPTIGVITSLLDIQPT